MTMPAARGRGSFLFTMSSSIVIILVLAVIAFVVMLKTHADLMAMTVSARMIGGRDNTDVTPTSTSSSSSIAVVVAAGNGPAFNAMKTTSILLDQPSSFNNTNETAATAPVAAASTPPTIFYCHETERVRSSFPWNAVFPEYQMEDLSIYDESDKPKLTWKGRLQKKHSNEYDIFMYGYNMGGSIGCSSIVMTWLLTTFQGHIVTYSGESPLIHPFPSKKPHMHYFGPVVEPTQYDIVTYFMQLIWYSNPHLKRILNPDALVHASQRPKGGGGAGAGSKEFFTVYMQSNCVGYREEAAGRISEIGPVHCLGRCQGKVPSSSSAIDMITSNTTTSTTTTTVYNLVDLRSNHTSLSREVYVDVYSQYRFCIVMENTAQKSYITEKILMAFAAGCIPIYYGTEEIFDIFNPKSFIFYNISNPHASLEQIQMLEHNRSKYKEMLEYEPIVVAGEETIQKYFSLDDSIGKGELKKRYREMIGLPEYNIV